MAELKQQVTTGGGTMTVACKLPHGIWLRLFKSKKDYEPVLGGGSREIVTQEELPERVKLNGFAVAEGGPSPKHRIVGGYGITENVPKDFWERWVEQNRTLDAVKNNLIFAYPDVASVTARATEQEEVKSGLERLNPDKLPKGLQTADRNKL